MYYVVLAHNYDNQVLLYSGITEPEESIFTYQEGTSFDTFNFPDFIPTFSPTFADPNLEAQALDICDGDSFCLFDIAATGNIAIGSSTLQGGVEFDTIVNISAPGEVTVASYSYS